jgi:hypothetical protein
MLGAGTAHANLDLSISAANAAAGSTGNSLEVLLTNTGGTAVEISAFTFELSSSTGAILYTEANTGLVAAPYLFDGISAFGPVISTTTGTTLDASDLCNAFTGGTTVGPGQVVGLGHVLFDVVGAASGSSLEITLAGFPWTSLSGSDATGLAVDLPITPPTPVRISLTRSIPEPGSSTLALAGLAVLGLAAWRRRPAVRAATRARNTGG